MKLGLRLMLFMESIFIFAGGLFGPIYAIFVAKVGGDLLDIGIASALYFISGGILMLLISKWEDHYKHKENLYIFGYFLSAWSFLGLIVIDNMYELFALQIIQGIGLAISTPVRDALYSTYIQKGKESSQWGYWEFSSSVAYAGAALGGGYLATVYGFQVLFATIFAALIIGVIIFTFCYKVYYKDLNTEKRMIKIRN